MSVEQSAAERLYAALATGDRAVLEEVLDPGFTGSVTAGMPLGLGGSYGSPASMQSDFWWRLGRTWAAAAQPEEFHLLDDGRLLVRGTYRGMERSTSAPLEAAFVHVLSFAGERIVALDQLTDSAAWERTLPPSLTTIRYEVEDGLALVTLDRPDQRNAIDVALAHETLEVARRLEADASVRAVLIRGNGPDFSVGGDISTFLEAGTADLGALLRSMTTPFHEAFRVLSRLEAPIVTATRGSVAGGGIGFVFASDISIASETSRFVTAFAGLGLSGDGGWTWHLPRRVGAARAAEIALTNRAVRADEAGAIGLVSTVVADDELDEHALDVARRLAQGPTRGFAEMRALLRETWSRSLSDQLAAETDGLVRTGRTADASEAVQAFMERRRPELGGR